MNFEEIFAARVHELRLKKGISQRQLGEAIGLSHKAISTIESGSRHSSITKLVALARFCDVSAVYLLGLRDTPKDAENAQE